MGAEFAKQSIGKQSKGKEGGYSDDALDQLDIPVYDVYPDPSGDAMGSVGENKARGGKKSPVQLGDNTADSWSETAGGQNDAISARRPHDRHDRARECRGGQERSFTGCTDGGGWHCR